MRTVIQLLHQAARNYGDMPYLGEKLTDDYSLTSYKETDRLSDAFAASLVKLGLSGGKNIALLSEGRSNWVIGEFGVLKAGCTSVPLSTKLTPDEILFRLDHSGAAGILTSENNFTKVARVIGRAELRPLVICISPKSESLGKIIAESGLTEGETLFFIDDLISGGLKAVENGEEFNGKPVNRILSEIEEGIGENDTVTISYTSGTTGNPKGIMLSHLNYWDNVHSSAEIVAVKKGWKTLIMLPLDHSFAHTVGLYIFLYRGLSMYFVDARGGPMGALRNLPKNLLEVNPDFLLTVPALSGNFMKKMTDGAASKGAFVKGLFERGVKAGIARAGNGYDKPSFLTRLAAFFPWALANSILFPKFRAVFGKDIKFCVGGGALLEIRQQEFFNAIGVPIYQGYGLTENAPIICSNSPRKHKFGTSGIIIPGLDVRIMKDETTECGPGSIGQIVTRGDSVMKGYYRNEEATKETIRDGWLWSGDLGFIDGDGFLVVTGREKALLISSDGEKYSPETIEEAIINTSKYVSQVMAYNEQNKFTSVLLTLNAEALKADLDGKAADSGELISRIHADLSVFHGHPEYSSIPAQWRPSSFAVIPKAFDEEYGLINSTLKLVRHKVRDHYRDRIDEIYASGIADPDTEGNRKALKELGF